MLVLLPRLRPVPSCETLGVFFSSEGIPCLYVYAQYGHTGVPFQLGLPCMSTQGTEDKRARPDRSLLPRGGQHRT